VSPSPGPRSRALWKRALGSFVGGVNSPVRSFRGVGGSPIFFVSGRGPYLRDADGRRYFDLVGSWGANLLGNAPPAVVRAVGRAARDGLTFGAPNPLELELSDRIRRAAPELERLRFVSSGTEAVMSAVRTARGFTGRSTIVMFEGGYHGHSDALLARAGSGVAAGARPSSAGVPRAVVAATRVLPYNDPDAVDRLFDRRGSDVAAVLVEPVAGNMGVVPPRAGFLETISRRARRSGALVIADEVITGFRLRPGTVHGRLGLTADLVTLGKVIGGGLPAAAYGGRRKVMETVAPEGPVYQAGTLSGNPVAMAAGAATLDALSSEVYGRLERAGEAVEEAILSAVPRRSTAELTVQRVGSMIGIFFGPGPVIDLPSARRANRARYARCFHAALDRGVYLPPSPLETAFVSAAMGPEAIARAAPALRAAVRSAIGRSQ
jgi:glutamate-1-semialdehyde 2,1-aminomutase